MHYHQLALIIGTLAPQRLVRTLMALKSVLFFYNMLMAKCRKWHLGHYGTLYTTRSFNSIMAQVINCQFYAKPYPINLSHLYIFNKQVPK
jgi:hypothetical protein